MSDIQDTLKGRAKTHGDWRSQAECQSELMLILCGGRAVVKFSHTQMAALQQITTKLSRIAHGDASEPDHWHDIAGYATLQEEVERENQGLNAMEVATVPGSKSPMQGGPLG